MSIFEKLWRPEVRSLVDRYHELTGDWVGYNWDEYGSIDDYVEKLKEKIAKAEEELGEAKNDQNPP